MSDQKNMLIAIALSMAILLSFQFFYEAPKIEKERERQEQLAKSQPQPNPSVAPSAADSPRVPGGSGAPPLAPAAVTAAQRTDALKLVPRISIRTPTLTGSISLKGGRIDDVVLDQYREEVEPGSDNIRLMSPVDAPKSYYVEYGWVGAGSGVKLPTSDTVWSADRAVLTPNRPVTLSWDNGEGLVFENNFAIDDGYMITMTQRVRNSGRETISVFPYGLVSRGGTPDTLGFYILHEGLLGVFDGTLQEVDYDDLQEEGKRQQATIGGWIGITDKYWLAALIPKQDAPVTYRFMHNIPDGDDRYQVDYLGAEAKVHANETFETTSRLFVGAKEVKRLDEYGERFGIANFDLAVDFGWFYFLTKPFFYAISWLNEWLGNFGLAILAFTVFVKALFYPLANKSYRSMAKLRELTPKLHALRDQYGDDKMRLNQEMMALYKEEKVNPAAGCLPILVQIPVFFALYKVLFVNIEMRHAPFYGWIKDLSAMDPKSIFEGFGYFPWGAPEFLTIGIWPILMGLTMWLQQRLNPQPTDPVQAKIFMFLPLFFTFLLGTFPAGLVIYWTWNNLLSIAQQKLIMWRMGVK